MNIIVWAGGDTGYQELNVAQVIKHYPKEWGDWVRSARAGDMITIDNVYLFAAADRIDSLAPNWQMTGSREKVEAEIGNGFRVRLGWAENGRDTALCIQYGNDEWLVQVWNQPGVRAEIAALLGLPVHQEVR